MLIAIGENARALPPADTRVVERVRGATIGESGVLDGRADGRSERTFAYIPPDAGSGASAAANRADAEERCSGAAEKPTNYRFRCGLPAATKRPHRIGAGARFRGQ
jgi:hypothetical protein